MSGEFDVVTSNQYIDGTVSYYDYKDENSDAENYTWVHAELRFSRNNTGFVTMDYEGGFYITIDGQDFFGENTNDKKIEYNSNTLMVSGDKKVYHNADGTKTIPISVRGSMPNASLSIEEQSWQATLTTIPRYATITSFSASAVTKNSITLSYSTDVAVDSVQYSLNNGSFQNLPSNNTITELNSDTTYSIKIQVRRADSQQWTTSNAISVTTLKDKLLKIKKDGVWVEAIPYVKVNGTWKEAKPYMKINNSWKEGI